MIVLDTNVLSEPLRARPDPYVIQWFEHLVEDAAVTAITVGEILTGVRSLPLGRRREDLMTSVEHTFLTYSDRILAYDDSAAREFASMQEARRLAGRALGVEDVMIAAICRVRGLTLATRNIKDFHDLGIDLIDPWAR